MQIPIGDIAPQIASGRVCSWRASRGTFRRWKRIQNVNGTCSEKSYVIVDQLQALDVTRRYVLPAMEEGKAWNLAHANHATWMYQPTGNADGGSP